MKFEFEARLVPTGPNGTWCYLEFPFDFQKTFGTRARVPVSGTINGFKFRSSFSPMGGKHLLCVNKQMQAGAKAKPGDVARFVFERDDKPRTVTPPPALKKMLASHPQAKSLFDQLSYTHRKEYADWIASAKQEETVKRRLEKLLPLLLRRSKGSRPSLK
ncbi:conserved hypothetical protein [Verrucomicrobia bacterium]|nr:conserved hypothetical protein [Verrucomicrobiota bacterium]